ncbi:universal stress protein [Actinoplanes sp. NBRC 14428]|uniref:Universal stress protein family protein n=1 Tax=Pseudosporangium ferrugineum TaxID=439699 RepID=A0A2T0SG64_9ACTN|nr:universal stress protein [Pseudosporangium ferrugineum]PRY32402.1 universal stress protein family protein [Pseudosporangium ferrugineum]BCJ49349.1 universal stress protein [Actinoplanes sp. NBRC 14428]
MDSAVWSKRNLPVVVGIDGSRSHPGTVDLAVDQAVRHRAPLLIVHVWPGRYSGSFRTHDALPTEDDGRHLLELAARRARHRAGNLTVSTELAAGSVSQILTARSESARLVVVGHRDAMPARASWGSTTAYLAHHAGSPLLVNRGTVPEHGPVVLAVSAREPVTATVGEAFEEAASTDSKLVAVHVWNQTGTRPPTGSLTTGTGYGEARREAERHLAEVLAGWSWRYPDVEVERLLLHDLDIGYTLERASRRGRLLVAGMGRSGRFVELIYGSLGTTLMRQAACPVLLVPIGWPAVTAASGGVTADGRSGR